MIASIIILTITLAYTILIGSFIYGFNKVKVFKRKENTISKNTFSIIIPFKNEAENLPQLITSLQAIDYPYHLFEIIFINDASTDSGEKLVESFQHHYPKLSIKLFNNVRQSKSPKKDAISFAISKSEKHWIVTTDADCVVPKKWLATLDAYIQVHHPKMLVMPVVYQSTKGFLSAFQEFDFLSLMASTLGSFGINKPFMCNGANLAYTKKAFEKLNGFKGNDTIASGDDIFMMEKLIASDQKNVHYLKSKNVIVTTKPQPSWTLLFEQRKRWAAKSTSYKNRFSLLVAMIVTLQNVAFFFIIFSLSTQILSLKIGLLCILTKFNIDFLLIDKMHVFTDKKLDFKGFLKSSVYYPIFVIRVVFTSFLSSYNWKGVNYNK